MTAAERLKKRFKGGVPHTTKKEKKEKFTHGGLYAKTKEESTHGGLYAERKFRERKSGKELR